MSYLLQAGVDYAPLRDFLKAGDFRKADDETRAMLVRLAGEDAVKRGWVYFTEVRKGDLRLDPRSHGCPMPPVCRLVFVAAHLQLLVLG